MRNFQRHNFKKIYKKGSIYIIFHSTIDHFYDDYWRKELHYVLHLSFIFIFIFEG
jgi:hypothetical protein